MHLCAELTASFWTLEPFGEIGANFSLQLSSQTRFDKINKKKVIAENQCEEHKKIRVYYDWLACSLLQYFNVLANLFIMRNYFNVFERVKLYVFQPLV